MSDQPVTLDVLSFTRFAQAADAVASTTKRLEKLAILAEYLSPLPDEDLAIACRLLSGNPFPSSSDRTLNVGFSVASTVLMALSGVEPDEYGRLAVRLGDLGDVAAQILPPQPVDPGEPITLHSALRQLRHHRLHARHRQEDPPTA